MTGPPAKVELQDLVASYGGAPVVDRLCLVAEPGTLTALLGPSGCGKTTTLKVVFDGTSVLRLPAEKRPVAMVFQTPLLFPHLSVGDNVGFGLRMRKIPTADRRTRAAEALDLVGLYHLAGRYAHQLSGGQQQRIALARALLSDAPVLILDEPATGLDADTERAFLSTLNDAAPGRTIVLIVHRLMGVERLDRIYRLSAGRAVAAAA